MREQVIQVVEQYIDAVRHNDASALPLHPDAVREFPTNTNRGAASYRRGLDDFARIMKSIDVIRFVVAGEATAIPSSLGRFPRDRVTSSPAIAEMLVVKAA